MPALAHDARPRWRGAITMALLFMISVMVVRDILARRRVQPHRRLTRPEVRFADAREGLRGPRKTP